MIKDILIVDDEPDICKQVGELLRDEGYHVRTAGNSSDAERIISERAPSLIILDIWLQGSAKDGLELLIYLKNLYPALPIIMMSGHATIETAVQAIHRGAEDVIEKPFKTDKLLHVLDRAFEITSLKNENIELQRKTGDTNQLIGYSNFTQQLKQTIIKRAESNARVLITGASGTGKTFVASELHRASKRSGAFVIAHCSTICDDHDIESRFFGTNGDNNRHIGLLEKAHGGTIFLDQFTDLPITFQNKLIKFLQENRFSRVGDDKQISVDVRIIASTKEDPKDLIASGKLKEDLYNRLNIVSIPMVPLSQRREDIIPLAQYFMKVCAKILGVPERQFAPDTLSALQSYDWPSNVRQLKHSIEWVLIMSTGNCRAPVVVDELPKEIYNHIPTILRSDRQNNLMELTLRDARQVFETEYLRAQLLLHNGNISRVANNIQMERSALHRKIKTLGLDSGE